VIGINSQVALPAALGGLQGLISNVNGTLCTVDVTTPLWARIRINAAQLTELAPPPQPEPALGDCVLVITAAQPAGVVFRRFPSGWAQPGDPAPTFRTWAFLLATGEVRLLIVHAATGEQGT
jgi:hypothetical protein